ncbi:MAG: hypothetical protein Q8P22_01400 [Chloroflexota bacterium]|nr:hypothetical protein [Chloroflexota bacterium]
MKYLDLVNAVQQILSGYTMTLTLRQVYYRLVVAGLIANTRSEYTQLSSQLVKAREEGDVDGSRIVDRSRGIEDMSFDSPESFIEACEAALERQYVRRFWDSQPVYCEVWVDKDALSQVLAQAVYPFNTIVAPSRGYSSYSYLSAAAGRINRHGSGGKRAVIFYFTDHDPSGLDMSRDLQDRLAKYCSGEVEVRRVALTYEQVKHYNLVPNPVKLADLRSNGYVKQYGEQCWELDAIEPTELIRLCGLAVEALITDRGAWLAIKEQDKADRQALLEQMGVARRALGLPNDGGA